MTQHRTAVPALRAASLAIALLAAGTTFAQRPSPIGVSEETIVTGKILEVNQDTKSVIVQGPRGDVYEIAGGDEVKNFGQIRKGDTLYIRHGQALVASLEPVDSKNTAIAEQVERTARAPEGGKPGIMREVTTTVVADITKVDAARRNITFRGPRETLRTVHVQDPAIDLSKIKQGDKAKIVYKEMVAIGVRAPGKAPSAAAN